MFANETNTADSLVSAPFDASREKDEAALDECAHGSGLIG
jgi:hypothetical protein